MAAWIWVLIPLVAIIGGYIIDYQKNKLKWRSTTASNENELEEVRSLVHKLKKRIENLEAIAAGSDALHNDNEARVIEYPQSEMGQGQIVEENEKIVSHKIKSRGN